MSETDLFGFELLFKTLDGSIKNKSDVLIATIHWYLIKNSFRNVGIGDDKTLSSTDVSSELLPERWNLNPNVYALRYVNSGDLYILHGLLSEETMIVNLLQVKSLNVSNTAFPIEDTVMDIRGGNLSVLIPEPRKFLDKIQKELLNPVADGKTKDSETQTKKDPVSTPANLLPRVPSSIQRFEEDFPSFGNVGRGDLDPLGRGGPGMLFQPPSGFNPLGNLRMPNRGGIPGARFDPFHPDQNRRQRTGPDNDHFPPPDYDDMFM